ncbi:MAG: hypothetical protein IJY25_04400 [Bacilli bacterium]|nr:hypothetical protein [Bacilli bacterium]
MSKLTINKSITNFLNRNKVRLAALGTASIMAATMTACTHNKNENTEITINAATEDQQDLKAHILDYITNMDVFKNEGVGGYYIHEELYEEAPGFTMDKNGNIVETNKNFIGYSQFFISFEDAELLELTEILEARVVWSQNVK